MIVNEIKRVDKEKNLLFVNKKKQKNLVNLINCESSQDRQGPIEQKLFAAFFQKRRLFDFT